MPASHEAATAMLPNNKLHEQSLQSSALELKYANSSHLVDIIAKDEDIRLLRFDIHILQDDNDELRDLLAQEEDRSEKFEKLVNDNLARAEDAEARLADIEVELRAREQDVGTLQAESKALQTSAADSEAFLTEKLALTRELSVLRPELEHMKVQAASTESLMTEKLELQRQLSNIQCELENAKRDCKRALAKRRNTGVEIAQEEQVEDLKRQLAKEKRARQRAEEAADTTQMDVNIDDVRKELAREKRARHKAEEELEAAQENTQVEDVRKDLLKEKKAKGKLEEALENLKEELEKEKKAAARAAKRAHGVAGVDDQLEEMKQELAQEKKERQKAERAAQQAADEFEAQKATLDEKLQQFRTKLRSTKEKLKETETELEAAREEAALQKKNSKAAPTAKNAKKRSAAQFEADATTLGTPGDGPAAKRGRKAAGIGDKSTFSMTPFLNKTASILPDSPEAEVDEAEDEEKIEEPAAASPSVETAAAKTKKKPLATVPASESNVPKKPAPRQRKQKVAAPVLEMVTEEAEDVHSQGQENAPGVRAKATKVKTKTADGTDEKPAAAEKKKKRKSLVDFASFDPEPETKKKEKKSRKLGGMGKTLFDEEEESAAPTKTLPGRALIGGRGFGALGAGTKKAGGFLGKSKIGSSILMTAGDGSGFQFSPLKRQRGNLDDTLRG